MLATWTFPYAFLPALLRPARAPPPPTPHMPLTCPVGKKRQTSQVDLRRECERFGEVIDAFIPLDRTTNQSRGFGFVTYRAQKDAQACIDDMHEYGKGTAKLERARESKSTRGTRAWGSLAAVKAHRRGVCGVAPAAISWDDASP